MRGPRVAWVAHEKAATLTKEQLEGFSPICSEFVIEILSWNYTLSELQAKMWAWIANGVEVAWLVDPVRKVVEVYRSGHELEVIAERIFGDGSVVGFMVELGRIWS